MTGIIPSWARPGVKVVCVDACASSKYGACPLKERGIYTIREVIDIREWRTTPYEGPTPFGIRVSEAFGVVNSKVAGDPWEVPFPLWRFRPLVEDTDDNEIEARLYHKHQLHLPLSKRLETAS